MLKSPSEHTVNGAHYDIEMQIFHQSTADDKKVKQAAISIMFSVEEYDKTIDEVNNKTL